MARLTDKKLREDIIRICLTMNEVGINQGSSGNVSARLDDGILITPSGMPYHLMKPTDIVKLYWDGSYEGERLPSSEWRFHLDIMRERDDCNAVIHTHATACTTLACLRMDIPAFHYMIAVAGGYDIRCSEYARFGTQQLSDHILKALEDRKACLMGNHGMLATGKSLDQTLGLAIEVENLANVYWRTLQVTRPVILTNEQMDEVIERIGAYGKQPEEIEEGQAPAFEAPPRRASA
ncbi:MAG: class II aldolase/adducin family protein [Geminicoccaceae bacterium]|nr:class II aldolase/adducin family protein [Geminicoccaceae bacterium]MCB9945260.1 class II aldolase/adducin family protein [Geminicoccaceae bacterium]